MLDLSRVRERKEERRMDQWKRGNIIQRESSNIKKEEGRKRKRGASGMRLKRSGRIIKERR